MSVDVWTDREDVLTQGDPTERLVGYAVEAADGSIGKIDEATMAVGSSYIVVDTGPWILGKQVVLPAQVIERVDHAEERVFVRLSEEQVKNAPTVQGTFPENEVAFDDLGDYYRDLARR
jgi:hypothetical protein